MKQNHVNANQYRGNMKNRYRENDEFRGGNAWGERKESTNGFFSVFLLRIILFLSFNWTKLGNHRFGATKEEGR